MPRVAEAGDAVRELPQRQLRIVLDVEVQIDQSWHQRATGQIQPLRTVRYFALSARLHALDAIGPDGHAHVVLRGLARAIDDPRVVQDQDPRRLTANGDRLDTHHDNEGRKTGARATGHFFHNG